MPPIAAAAAAISTALSATAFALPVIGAVSWGTVVQIGVGLVGSFVAKRKAEKAAEASRIEGTLQTVRSSNAPRELVYGTTRKGGVILYANTNGGSENEYLNMVIAMAHTPVNSVGDVYFGDDIACNPETSFVGSDYTGFLDSVRGLGDQTSVNSTLQTWIGGDWASTAIMYDTAYLGLRLKWDQETYPEGIPTVTAVIQGKSIYDPRTTSTNFSNNPALVLLDILRNEDYGLGVSDDAINFDSFSAAANVCEEQIPLSAGGTENRYTCDGVITTAAAPLDIIEEVCKAMAGSVTYTGGEFHCIAGKWNAPVADLTQDDIIANPQIVTATSRRDAYNAVQGQFASPENNYVGTDYPPLISDTLAARDGRDLGAPISSGATVDGTGYRINSVDGGADFTGVGADANTVGLIFIANGGTPTWGAGELQEKSFSRRYSQLDLPLTKSSAMAQRIAKIGLLEARQEITVDVTFRLSAESWKPIPGDNITLTIDRMGWDQKAFRVLTWSDVPMEGENGNVGSAVKMTLKETAEENYLWDTSEEQEIDPAPNTNLPSPRVVQPPTNLVLQSGAAHFYLKTDGTVVSRIFVDWDESNDSFVTSGGFYELQYKLSSASQWQTLSPVQGGSTSAYVWDVEDSSSYDVRVRAYNVLGVFSSWLTGSITPSGKSSAGGLPANPVFTTTYSGFRLSWDFPIDSDFLKFKIYRKAISLNAFTLVYAETLNNTIDIPFPPGDFSYWGVSTVNRSGVESSIQDFGRNPSRPFQYDEDFDLSYPTSRKMYLGFATQFVALFGAGPNYNFDNTQVVDEQFITSPDGGVSYHTPSFDSLMTIAGTDYDICWRYSSTVPFRPSSDERQPSPWVDTSNDAVGSGNLWFMLRENAPNTYNVETLVNNIDESSAFGFFNIVGAKKLEGSKIRVIVCDVSENPASFRIYEFNSLSGGRTIGPIINAASMTNPRIFEIDGNGDLLIPHGSGSGNWIAKYDTGVDTFSEQLHDVDALLSNTSYNYEPVSEAGYRNASPIHRDVNGGETIFLYSSGTQANTYFVKVSDAGALSAVGPISPNASSIEGSFSKSNTCYFFSFTLGRYFSINSADTTATGLITGGASASLPNYDIFAVSYVSNNALFALGGGSSTLTPIKITYAQSGSWSAEFIAAGTVPYAVESLVATQGTIAESGRIYLIPSDSAGSVSLKYIAEDDLTAYVDAGVVVSPSEDYRRAIPEIFNDGSARITLVPNTDSTNINSAAELSSILTPALPNNWSADGFGPWEVQNIEN